MSNELRERVVLRVDGGMRNGRDVLVSAALGGDEYGFGTVAMIATGCIMVRAGVGGCFPAVCRCQAGAVVAGCCVVGQ